MLAANHLEGFPVKIELMAQVRADMARLAKNQLPYVTSLAVNKTAIGARDFVRRELPTKFTLRNNWTRMGVQARTGNKADPTAYVRAPGYMAIQETGGTRAPTRSRLLAAPVGVKSSSLIPRAKRPRALLGGKAFVIDMKGGDAGVFVRYGKKRGQIRLLWWLSDEQKYQEAFEFEADVRAHVEARFGANFVAALVQAGNGRK